MSDLISRREAIDALDGNVIVVSRKSAQAVIDYIRGCADKIRSLPSAQPELIEKAAYIRGFEQGRTQGMIDTKAEEVAQTNLQPTCNQLATDTISRQAAIDAICKEGTRLERNGTVAMCEIKQWCIDLLERLPSAQPEPQWIPCSERLPEYDGEMYLVTDYCEQINRRRIHVSYCYVNREGFWSDVPLGYKVLAWMPLPEPYKGES